MRPDAIARRYARALFQLAEAGGTLEQVGTSLAAITDALANPNVMRVLTGPLSREQKRSLLLKIVEATKAPALVRDFLLLLAEHARLKNAPTIRVVFDQLLDARQGVTRATVRSAVALAPEMVEEISRVFGSMTGKRVLPKVEIVPDLIAGIIVDVEGRVYDGSLRTQLAKLHQQMATGS